MEEGSVCVCVEGGGVVQEVSYLFAGRGWEEGGGSYHLGLPGNKRRTTTRKPPRALTSNPADKYPEMIRQINEIHTR